MFNNSYQQHAAATVRIVQSQQVTDHWENFLSSDAKRKQMCSLVRSNCQMGHVWHIMQFADLLAAFAFACPTWGKLGEFGQIRKNRPIAYFAGGKSCSTNDLFYYEVSPTPQTHQALLSGRAAIPCVGDRLR